MRSWRVEISNDRTMMKPKRIQRKRTKGWRMPEGAVYVGRGSVWGNPFVVGNQSGIFDGQDGRPLGIRDQREILVPSLTLAQCIEFYRDMVRGFIGPEMYPFAHDWRAAFARKISGHPSEWARASLRGKDLACFCPLDQRCHADVLLDLANH
jgi:hypothetical protein